MTQQPCFEGYFCDAANELMSWSRRLIPGENLDLTEGCNALNQISVAATLARTEVLLDGRNQVDVTQQRFRFFWA
jgi:hypothetical protein